MQAPGGNGATTPDLAMRLRARRKTTGKTLQQIARESGLSVGFISQIERGLATPSLSSLTSVARALGVGADYFIRIPEAHPASGPDTAGPAGTGVDAHGVTYERVSRSFPGSRINAVIMQIPPGHASRPSRHGGEEMVYVLNGRVASTVDGEEMILEARGFRHFDSRSRHNLRNVGDRTATILWVGTLPIFGSDNAGEGTP